MKFYKRMACVNLLAREILIDTRTCLEASRIQKAARGLARTYPNEKLFTLKDGTQMTAEEYYYYLCAKNKEMLPQCRFNKAKERTAEHSCDDLFTEKEKHS